MPRMSYAILPAVFAAAALAASASAAEAGDPVPARAEAPSPFAEAALGDAELGRTRGTAGMGPFGDVALNIAEQTAEIGDNAINAATTTGAITNNTIEAVQGISMFNMNSGNFNSFQNIFQLNIKLGQ